LFGIRVADSLGIQGPADPARATGLIKLIRFPIATNSCAALENMRASVIRSKSHDSYYFHDRYAGRFLDRVGSG
jgi:hypothetical protein